MPPPNLMLASLTELLVMQHQEIVPSLTYAPPPDLSLLPVSRPPVSVTRSTFAPPATVTTRVFSEGVAATCLMIVLSQPWPASVTQFVT